MNNVRICKNQWNSPEWIECEKKEEMANQLLCVVYWKRKMEKNVFSFLLAAVNVRYASIVSDHHGKVTDISSLENFRFKIQWTRTSKEFYRTDVICNNVIVPFCIRTFYFLFLFFYLLLSVFISHDVECIVWKMYYIHSIAIDN